MSLNKNFNSLGKALSIVEKSQKYKKNMAIMAIMTSLDFSRKKLEHELSIQVEHRKIGYYPFMDYIEGVRGKFGYNFNLSPDEILYEFKAPMIIAQLIIEISAKGECLILALNALGEDIEY